MLLRRLVGSGYSKTERGRWEIVEGLDHVQLAMPRGGERRARAYFAGLLGLAELEKPPSLAGRANQTPSLPDGRQLHLGVEEPFRSSAKAHPNAGCGDLDGLARRIEEGGYAVRWDGELAPRRRFYGEDPFGNRVEFIES